MHKIKVTRPFSLRLGSGQPLRAFSPGTHDISDEEMAHWFVQACINDGLAELVSAELAQKEAATAPDGLVSPTREELLSLKADVLKALCSTADITVPSGNPAKAVLADLLLAEQAHFALVKDQDGIFVQKKAGE